MKEKIKTTLTYPGKSVDMDTPEAGKLITEMVQNLHPELKGGLMDGKQIKAELKCIRNVEVKSKVESPGKDLPPQVMTAVKFEYVGEPSQVQVILIAEAAGTPINATLYSLQGVLPLEAK